MKTTTRMLLIACMALSFAACKKQEAAPAQVAQEALIAPDKDDDDGWKAYLPKVVERNMGSISNNPFLYYLPPESDPQFQEKYDRQLDSAKAAMGRGIQSGNMLAFGSSASARMGDLIIESFKDVPAETMKGVRVVYIGDAADNERVQAAVAPSGVDYVFVEAR